jgi:hypothetical protein
MCLDKVRELHCQLTGHEEHCRRSPDQEARVISGLESSGSSEESSEESSFESHHSRFRFAGPAGKAIKTKMAKGATTKSPQKVAAGMTKEKQAPHVNAYKTPLATKAKAGMASLYGSAKNVAATVAKQPATQAVITAGKRGADRAAKFAAKIGSQVRKGSLANAAMNTAIAPIDVAIHAGQMGARAYAKQKALNNQAVLGGGNYNDRYGFLEVTDRVVPPLNTVMRDLVLKCLEL